MDVKNLNGLLPEISTKIKKNITHYNDMSVSYIEFVDKVTSHFKDATISAIQLAKSDEDVYLYINFAQSIIHNVYSDVGNGSKDIKLKYETLQNIIALLYIYSGSLIRNKKYELASNVLAWKDPGIMEGHYISRAVLTMSSRIGIVSKEQAWFIGSAANLSKQYEDLGAIFFHNEKNVLSFTCQADFLQFVKEFEIWNSVNDGYPSFLFYEFSYTEPILSYVKSKMDIEKLRKLLVELNNMHEGELIGSRWFRPDVKEYIAGI